MGAARSSNFAPKPFYGRAFSGSIASVGSGRRGDQMNDGAKPDIEPTSPDDRVYPPTGHEPPAFAAMHGYDPLYSGIVLGLGSSRRRGASSLACLSATPPRLLHWPHEKTDWEENHARDRSCFAQYRNNGFLHRFCPISKVVRNSGTELEEVWNVTHP